MHVLLNLIYLVIVVLVSPVLIYRRLVYGKYKTGWSEKLLGRLPVRTTNNTCIWFHAVSVGEVLQLRTVVAELLTQRPDGDIVISTTTSTGHDVARRTFPDHTVCYFPLDFSWSVKNAIRRVSPTAIVLVELEIWPNLIRFARQANVPCGLINGRISANSYRGYRRIRFAVRRTFASLSFAAVQNSTYANRIADLGVPTDRICVTGSVKFDGLQTDRNNPNTNELRSHFGIAADEPVFIAGSTQEPEEQFAIDTYQSLRGRFPDLRLILVPRHQERFEQVAGLVKDNRLPLVRRTDKSPASTGHSKEPPVLLLDTLGELSACWGLADIAFVGGSLTNRGGQNMIEPAGYGAAVLFGPNTRNFRDVVEMLLDASAAQIVHDAKELTETVCAMLTDSDKATRMGRCAAAIALSQQGATARTVDSILALLGSGPRSQQAA
jgi:3-deoxy-D-manno-octulosonic-acid transferase